MALKTVRQGSKALFKAIRALEQSEVLVGFPANEAPRQEGDGPSNALIAYVQNYGSPEKNIPARPFMEPGIKAAQGQIQPGLLKAAKAAVVNNQGGVQAGLVAAGLAGVAGIRNAIDDGIPPPLSEKTIKARMRARKSGLKGGKQELANREAGLPASTDLVKPLIDTAQMRNAVTYVVANKRDRS